MKEDSFFIMIDYQSSGSNFTSVTSLLSTALRRRPLACSKTTLNGLERVYLKVVDDSELVYSPTLNYVRLGHHDHVRVAVGHRSCISFQPRSRVLQQHSRRAHPLDIK